MDNKYVRFYSDLLGGGGLVHNSRMGHKTTRWNQFVYKPKQKSSGYWYLSVI